MNHWFVHCLGIRLWNYDLRISDNPLEAGLGSTLRPYGDYLGKQAIEEIKQNGIKKRLAFFTIKE